MDVRESDRKTGNGEGQPDGKSRETGGRLCARGREKWRNRRKAVRARMGKVDNGVRAGGEQQLRWITCRQH